MVMQFIIFLLYKKNSGSDSDHDCKKKCKNKCKVSCFCFNGGVDPEDPTKRIEDVFGVHSQLLEIVKEGSRIDDSVLFCKTNAHQKLNDDALLKAGSDTLEESIDIRYEVINTSYESENFCVTVSVYGKAIYSV